VGFPRFLTSQKLGERASGSGEKENRESIKNNPRGKEMVFLQGELASQGRAHTHFGDPGGHTKGTAL